MAAFTLAGHQTNPSGNETDASSGFDPEFIWLGHLLSDRPQEWLGRLLSDRPQEWLGRLLSDRP